MDKVFYIISKVESALRRLWATISGRRSYHPSERRWSLLRRSKSSTDVSFVPQSEVINDGQTIDSSISTTIKELNFFYSKGDRGVKSCNHLTCRPTAAPYTYKHKYQSKG